MTDPENIEVQLLEWSSRQLKQQGLSLESLFGDASFRRYYRIRGVNHSYIAAYAPPQRKDNEAFVAVQNLFAGHGVNVPSLLGWERQRGFLLQRDFGDQLLLRTLTEATAEQQYQSALDALLAIQRIPVSEAKLSLYDEQRLMDEMGLFPEWFVQRLLGVDSVEIPAQLLESFFTELVKSARSQPQRVVHRDYHSRNLMVLPDGELGVIDFQDAVVGPITYDPVSLLRDCYIRWPEVSVAAWALAYRDRLVSEGLMPPCDDAQFMRWFDLMGLQRHIKVLGIFARLWLRDGKSGYLKDLPLVIDYTLSIARRYPEFESFVSWFEELLMPRVAKQEWSSAQ